MGVAGGGQVLITGAAVISGSMLLGLSPASAWILGGIVCMSSTALAMRLLADEGQLDSPQGQVALAVLIFQDLSLVPFLLAIPFLAAGSSPSATELGFSVLRTVLALGGVLFIVRFAVPRILNRVAETRSPDLFSLLALLIVLGSAFLAEEVGLSLAVGAFLAGVGTTFLIYALARPGRGGTDSSRLLLVGIAVNAIGGAFAGYLTYLATAEQLQSLMFWSMGSLSSARWLTVGITVIPTVVGITLLMVWARPLDLLALGERQARHLGVDVRALRRKLVAEGF